MYKYCPLYVQYFNSYYTRALVLCLRAYFKRDGFIFAYDVLSSEVYVIKIRWSLYPSGFLLIFLLVSLICEAASWYFCKPTDYLLGCNRRINLNFKEYFTLFGSIHACNFIGYGKKYFSRLSLIFVLFWYIKYSTLKFLTYCK